jgi:hypothetical protein
MTTTDPAPRCVDCVHNRPASDYPPTPGGCALQDASPSVREWCLWNFDGVRVPQEDPVCPGFTRRKEGTHEDD